MDDRRIVDQLTTPLDGAYALAILFTIGYFAFLGTLMFVPIPDQNKELMLTLAGILSGAMIGIVKYFYDGSKSADKVQAANIARSVKSESVVQEIAKTAPVATAAAVAAQVAATSAAAIPGTAVPLVPVPPGTEPPAAQPALPTGGTS